MEQHYTSPYQSRCSFFIINVVFQFSIYFSVTKEHREQLAKGAKQYFIKCRDTIKDTQMKNVKKIKKKDGVSEDLAKSVEAQLAAIAEEFISQANKILESKQNELIGKE